MPGCSVEVADVVGIEGPITGGRVINAGGVVQECAGTGRIGVASAVESERIIAGGCIVEAAGVERERKRPGGRVAVAGSALFKSASAPLAVLSSPVVSLKSAE